ncbi:integrase catalytic domain-containing protein [Trichonephila clavipes]|nr:integrase catalytic domain-containing protein [Trichonephila clavipes]
MDLERTKEKRKILRMSFTKHLTKIELTLSKEISAEFNKEAKLEELLSLKSQLTEKLNELIKADDNIQLQIKIRETAADISSCEEYKDRGIDLKTKLRRQIEILSGKQEIWTSGPSTVNRDNTLFILETKIKLLNYLS